MGGVPCPARLTSGQRAPPRPATAPRRTPRLAGDGAVEAGAAPSGAWLCLAVLREASQGMA